MCKKYYMLMICCIYTENMEKNMQKYAIDDNLTCFKVLICNQHANICIIYYHMCLNMQIYAIHMHKLCITYA